MQYDDLNRPPSDPDDELRGGYSAEEAAQISAERTPGDQQAESFTPDPQKKKRKLAFRAIGITALAVLLMLAVTGRLEALVDSVRDAVSPPAEELASAEPAAAEAPVALTFVSLDSHPDKMFAPYTAGDIPAGDEARLQLIQPFRDLLDTYEQRQGIDDNFTVRVLDKRSNETLEVFVIENLKTRYEETKEANWDQIDRQRRVETRRLVAKWAAQGVPKPDISVKWGRANQVLEARERDAPYIAYEIQLTRFLGLSLLTTEIGTVETFNQDRLVSSVDARSRYQMMPYILNQRGIERYQLQTGAGGNVTVNEEWHPLLTMLPSFLTVRGYTNAAGHEIPGVSSYHTGLGNMFNLYRLFLNNGQKYLGPNTTVVDAYMWAVTEGFPTVSGKTSFKTHSRGYIPSNYGALRATDGLEIDRSKTFRGDRVQLAGGQSLFLSQLVADLDSKGGIEWPTASEDSLTTYQRLREMNPHMSLPSGEGVNGVPITGDVKLVAQSGGDPVRFFLPLGAVEALETGRATPLFDASATFRYDENTYSMDDRDVTEWDRAYDEMIEAGAQFGFTYENRTRLGQMKEQFDRLYEQNPSFYRMVQRDAIRTHYGMWRCKRVGEARRRQRGRPRPRPDADGSALAAAPRHHVRACNSDQLTRCVHAANRSHALSRLRAVCVWVILPERQRQPRYLWRRPSPMTALEIAANGFVLASVYAARRNSIHTWWSGIIGVTLYAVMFWQAKLYADVVLQGFFVATSVVGWWQWTRGGTGGSELPVTRLSGTGRAIAVVGAVGASVAMGYLFSRFTDAALPYADSYILGASVVAQLLMMRRKSWPLGALDHRRRGSGRRLLDEGALSDCRGLRPAARSVCARTGRMAKDPRGSVGRRAIAVKRFATGLVVGKFAPLHRGHQRLIDAAMEACERVVVMTWSNPEIAGMPVSVRADWVRALYPDALVMGFEADQAPPNDAPAEAHHAFVRAHLPLRVDAVFTAEAYGAAFAQSLAAEHVALDRSDDHVSGTLVRGDVHRWRAMIDPRVYAHFVEKVVLMGAESSGKSTLGKALAKHFGTVYVEEYGRTLWEERGGTLSLPEYVDIAEGHLALEETALLRAHRFAFVDTNAITTQQYAFFFHGDCPPRVRHLADACKQRYDHVFVCAPDFAFDQDGTRVHPQVQQYMDGAIRNDLAIRGIAYTVVTGSVEARVMQVEARLAGRAHG